MTGRESVFTKLEGGRLFAAAAAAVVAAAAAAARGAAVMPSRAPFQAETP